jgi:cytidine deaminase
MKRKTLSLADKELVQAAVRAVKKPSMQYWGKADFAQVGAALRLDNGKIITATNLVADVASLSLCAEPTALAQAARMPLRKVTAIVAVYLPKGGTDPKVIPPCGRCREIITDYAPHADVILREPGDERLFKLHASVLLPFKYASFWDGKDLL